MPVIVSRLLLPLNKNASVVALSVRKFVKSTLFTLAFHALSVSLAPNNKLLSEGASIPPFAVNTRVKPLLLSSFR